MNERQRIARIAAIGVALLFFAYAFWPRNHLALLTGWASPERVCPANGLTGDAR